MLNIFQESPVGIEPIQYEGEPSVVQMVSDAIWGYGVVVGKILLTTQHVVEQATERVKVLDTMFDLSKGIGLYTGSKTYFDTTDYDFAITKNNKCLNTLKLSAKLPKIGQQLEFHTIRNNKRLIINCTVSSIDDNFITCKMDSDIFVGECGSPIISDGIVYGILNLGDKTQNHSSSGKFHSSCSIYNKVRTIESDFFSPKFIYE